MFLDIPRCLVNVPLAFPSCDQKSSSSPCIFMLSPIIKINNDFLKHTIVAQCVPNIAWCPSLFFSATQHLPNVPPLPPKNCHHLLVFFSSVQSFFNIAHCPSTSPQHCLISKLLKTIKFKKY